MNEMLYFDRKKLNLAARSIYFLVPISDTAFGGRCKTVYIGGGGRGKAGERNERNTTQMTNFENFHDEREGINRQRAILFVRRQMT